MKREKCSKSELKFYNMTVQMCPTKNCFVSYYFIELGSRSRRLFFFLTTFEISLFLYIYIYLCSDIRGQTFTFTTRT